MDLEEGIEAFRDFYLREGYSPSTLKLFTLDVKDLHRFLKAKGVRCWDGLSPEIAAQYQVELLDKPWSTQRSRLKTLRRMGDFLLKEGILFQHPGEGLKRLRRESILPLEPLEREEVQAILAGCDLETRFGIRDHALFMVLWEGCLTVHEAFRLTLDDLSEDLCAVIIRGSRHSRMISLSAEGQASLRRYFDGTRDHFIRFLPDEQALFVTPAGRPFDLKAVSTTWPRLVGPYLKRARIVKKVSAHAFKWARVKALVEQGVSKDEVRALAGYHKATFWWFLKRIRK